MPARRSSCASTQARCLGLRADRHDRDRPRSAGGASASSMASRSIPAAQPTPGTSGPPISRISPS